MNRKRISQTRKQMLLDEHKKDPRSSLLLCCAFVLGINLLCMFLLTPFYQYLGELSDAYKVDIEKKDTVLHVLVEIGANAFFYISSFLGTVAFFIGAAYVCRFSYFGFTGKSVGASFLLFFCMFAPTTISVLVFLWRKLNQTTGEFVRLSDPYAILFEFLFLAFRVLVIALIAYRLSRAKTHKEPAVYAKYTSVFMLACALILEILDTTIPYLSSGKAQTSDAMLIAASFCLYVIHAVVGYKIVCLFMLGRKKKEAAPV